MEQLREMRGGENERIAIRYYNIFNLPRVSKRLEEECVG